MIPHNLNSVISNYGPSLPTCQNNVEEQCVLVPKNFINVKLPQALLLEDEAQKYLTPKKLNVE